MDTYISAIFSSNLGTHKTTIFSAIACTNKSTHLSTIEYTYKPSYVDTDISANDSSIENPFVYAHVDSNIATIGYSI